MGLGRKEGILMANEKRKRNTSPQTFNVNKKKTKPIGLQKAKSLLHHTMSITISTKEKRVSPDYDLKAQSENNTDKNMIKPSIKLNNTNFINHLLQLQTGFCKPSTVEQVAEAVCTQQIKMLHLHCFAETPERRVTAMQWHPTNPHMFVIGGKSGTLQLFKLTQDKKIKEMNLHLGIGPGGTIEAVKFNTKCSEVEVCTASVDGTVSTHNFDTEIRKTLVDTETPKSTWFCTVEVHQDGKSIYAGDNKGRLAIHHLDSGRSTYDVRGPKLHSSKIKHLEFSVRDPNLFVTASLDKSVKLWDIRKLTESLECLEHDTGVSSATFSLTNGCRLLTTDLKDQLRVYQAQSWTLEHQIHHPHRHFQHITTMRASWHPHADVFVIGRYPDPSLPHYSSQTRSVDVYSAVTGKLNYELMDSSRLLTSLAYFNCNGTALTTTSGRTLYMWM